MCIKKTGMMRGPSNRSTVSEKLAGEGGLEPPTFYIRRDRCTAYCTTPQHNFLTLLKLVGPGPIRFFTVLKVLGQHQLHVLKWWRRRELNPGPSTSEMQMLYSPLSYVS